MFIGVIIDRTSKLVVKTKSNEGGNEDIQHWQCWRYKRYVATAGDIGFMSLAMLLTSEIYISK